MNLCCEQVGIEDLIGVPTLVVGCLVFAVATIGQTSLFVLCSEQIALVRASSTLWIPLPLVFVVEVVKAASHWRDYKVLRDRRAKGGEGRLLHKVLVQHHHLFFCCRQIKLPCSRSLTC